MATAVIGSRQDLGFDGSALGETNKGARIAAFVSVLGIFFSVAVTVSKRRLFANRFRPGRVEMEGNRGHVERVVTD